MDNPVQSLSRALDLLEALAGAEAGLTLGEAAQACGLAPSTAHRLLKSLEQRRFAFHDEERGRWSVGVQAFAVGSAFLRGRSLVAAARPHMRDLMEAAGETVNLAIAEDGEALYLAQVECRQMMRAFSRPGSRAPLHCSGVGKALLAALPDAAPELRGRDLPRLTEHTLTDPAILLEELAAARARGYAVDDEEHAAGLRCVAAAIHDETGAPVAALSVSGPAVRIPRERLDELGRLVAAAAAAVTRDLGGRPPG